MPSAIDLCQVADVRAWLNINPQQDGVVNTTVTAPISAGLGVDVEPATIVGIRVGCILGVVSSTGRENVVVASVDDSGTFKADFSLSHAANATLTDQTDAILGRLITANSVTLMRKMGRMADDGSVPAKSTLVETVSFNQWYDGNGNQQLFLRDTPIATVTKVTIGAVEVPASTGVLVPGYVINQNRKSISLRTGGFVLPSRSRMSPAGWTFARGIQNVNVQYTAGFATTPDDIVDACIELVALCYKRRNWIDQEQHAQTDSIGTVKYRSWEIPPRVLSVIDDYKRKVVA